MYSAWIANEHYRLHMIEEWPESAYKQAALSAARSAIASLLRNPQAPKELPLCHICLNRDIPSTRVIEFPKPLAAERVAA